MSTPTHYQYADGSANVYIIKADSLEYIPVTPEESATGMYSGGEPKKAVLTPEEFRNTFSDKNSIYLKPGSNQMLPGLLKSLM
jgi:hypothetical protein